MVTAGTVRTMWRRTWGPTGAALALAASLAPGAAPAQTPAPAAGDLAAAIAGPWAKLQQPDGSFRDYVLVRNRRPSGDRYGPAMLGYGLLQRAAVTGDRATALTGLRAVRFALAHRTRSMREVFEDLALAAAYAPARATLAGAPELRALLPRWQAALRAMRPRVFTSRRPYYNYYLVQGLAMLELLRTGLRSTVPGAVLRNPARSRAAVVDVVGRQLPAVTLRTATASPAGPLVLASDPPSHPLAYHGLSVALLARILELLGPSAPAHARAVLAHAARASWALISPDGDLSYSGRSQEQSWTLAMTAAGAAMAGAAAGTSTLEAARDRGVAERALRRLAEQHVGGPFGMWIAPALRQGLTAGLHGLDPYVAAGSYTGLTLVALDWTAAALDRLAVAPAPLGADAPGAFHVGHGSSAFVTVRRPTVWFVVRQAQAVHVHVGVDYFTDLRYDAGLVALDLLRPDGTWSPVVPLRPRTARVFDSAGPLLRDRTGAPARPAGRHVQVRSDGTVLLDAVFRRRDGRAIAHRALRFRPLDCGVAIDVPARAGERWEYSAFFAGPPRRRGARAAADAHHRVEASTPMRLAFERGYASGDEAQLTRARLTFAPARTQTITITECGTP